MVRKLNEAEDQFIVRELQVQHARHKCFMVAADFDYKEQFYSPTFWPKGVGYKRFNFRLHDNYKKPADPETFLE